MRNKLFKYTLHIPTAFFDVSLNASCKHQIRVALNEYLNDVKERLEYQRIDVTLRSYKARKLGSCKAMIPSAEATVKSV